MRILKLVACLAALGLVAGCNRDSNNSGASAGDQGTSSGSAQGSKSSSEVDNTRQNAQDRSGQGLTPGDQGASEADRETTRRIRRAVNSNDQLSAEAKNIKIITQDGKVTLRGPVKTTQEKTAIESIVQRAGVNSFDDQLAVKETNQ
jgi:osmotically-inducible protein OsmY